MPSTAIDRLVQRLYGQPIIRNVLRGELVEQFVLDALGSGWRPAGDYEAWDVESEDGSYRIQVKQSAARQSWAEVDCKPSGARFSIKPSRSWTEADGWNQPAIRHANYYVLAWHPLVGMEADHRDASQWEFCLLPSSALPDQASISLQMARSLGVNCKADALLAAFESMKGGGS